MATAPIAPGENPQQRFTELTEAFVGLPDVAVGTDATRSKHGFGSTALTIHGSIFAMLVDGKLVVKLPRHRVDALVTLGEGERFNAGRPRPLKEWVTIDEAHASSWQPLASEAFQFVAWRG